MALFKSNTLTSISGSVGGTTYTKGKSGMVMRARAVPTDPRSPAQAKRRGNHSVATDIWNNVLDADQRNAWNVFARNMPRTNPLGDERTITGQQQFIGAELLILTGQLANAFDPPPIFERTFVSQLTAVADTPSPALEFTVPVGHYSPTPDGTTILFYVSKPLSPGRSYYKGPWIYAGNADGDGSGNISQSIAFNMIADSRYQYSLGQSVKIRLSAITSVNNYATNMDFGPFTLV